MGVAKNRKQKQEAYRVKYQGIPLDQRERLEYMYDKYRVSEAKAYEIAMTKQQMINSLQYFDLNIVLLEEPEGAKRPRFRIIGKRNFNQAAIASPEFVHVYSPNAKDDNNYMHRLVDQELVQLDSMISTPCIIEFNAYFKTPEYYNTTQKFMAELGLDRTIAKPDWDNIGKKYSDMYNSNIWIDDSLVTSGTVNKFYSILPRVEIKLRYLNMLYNKHQYKSILKRTGIDIPYFGGGI